LQAVVVVAEEQVIQEAAVLVEFYLLLAHLSQLALMQLPLEQEGLQNLAEVIQVIQAIIHHLLQPMLLLAVEQVVVLVTVAILVAQVEAEAEVVMLA
jgi:hypothetical protein